jgi:hypothetical protein
MGSGWEDSAMRFSKVGPLVFLVSLVIVGSSQITAARVATGTLAGLVLDAHGSPVSHASVTLQTSDGEHPHATYTDSGGHFEFSRFERGQYDLRAYSKGAFSDWMKRVAIHAGKTTQVTLRLTN